VRVRGRAARLPVRALRKIPSTMRAALLISRPAVKGRVTTFTAAVAIDDLRAAARTLSAVGAAPALDLEIGDKTFPALSTRGATGPCPPPRFVTAVNAAVAGLRIGTGASTWRQVGSNAVENSKRWCAADPLLRSQSHDGFTCSSRLAGLTCRNLSGHGFLLSRQRSLIF
jgi:hypothetical protein